MNIFEALKKGEGKAAFANSPDKVYAYYKNGRFLWNGVIWDVCLSNLERNDWIPYVPPEERKIEGMVAFKNPWTVYRSFVNELKRMGYNDDFIEKFVVKPNVPRETCSNCGFPSYPGTMVKLTSDNKCVECGRGDIFEVVPPPKTKQTEVFENVTWVRGSSVDWIHPYIVKAPFAFDKFLRKDTKVIIEWEE